MGFNRGPERFESLADLLALWPDQFYVWALSCRRL
jgi:hypothetical protein